MISIDINSIDIYSNCTPPIVPCEAHILFIFHLDLQFPIGIDSDRFIRALELPKVQDHIKELKERFAGRKVRAHVFLFVWIHKS